MDETQTETATETSTDAASMFGAAPEPATEAPAALAAPAEAQAEGVRIPGLRTIGFDKSVEERRVRAHEHWERVAAARENGETLEGMVVAVVKGGLRIDIGGVSGFLPASQIRLEAGAPLESLVKTKLPLKVIDVDATRKRVVVSHRRALDDLRRTKRSQLLSSLKIGDVHEGTVVRLAPFGAFVDIGGVDGLVPMSELAFERVEKVSDVLAVGDTFPVAVLRIEEGGRKIALSRKGALADPWRDHAAVVRQGATIEGTVVAKDPKLQVEIAPGVIGSVRESDADPNDYAIGEAIEVSVRSIDRRNRRITLTTLHGANVAAAPSSGFAPLGIELRKS